MFSWLSFLTYACVTAVTPGPNNLMSMSVGARYGLKGSLPFNFGILFGFSIVMLMCTFFCNTLSEFLPSVMMPLLVIGCAYMLWLAWKIYKSPNHLSEHNSEGGFLAGALLQFVNPKIYVYCIVSMQAYILPYYKGDWAALVFFALLLAVIGCLFTILWSAFGSVFRRLFSEYAHITNPIMALALAYCAVALFF